MTLKCRSGLELHNRIPQLLVIKEITSGTDLMRTSRVQTRFGPIDGYPAKLMLKPVDTSTQAVLMLVFTTVTAHGVGGSSANGEGVRSVQ